MSNWKIGDRLRSEWGYEVVVYALPSGELVGGLVCAENHSCKNIPYSLDGEYTLVEEQDD